MSRKRKSKPVPDHLKPIEGVSWKKGEPEPFEKLKDYFQRVSNASIAERRLKWLSVFREDFEAEGNPLCAWDAYLLSRKDGVPVPEWVLQYFDMVGKRLLDAKRKAKDLPLCLGFETGPGPGPWKGYLVYQIRRTAMTHILNLLEKHPETSIDDACAQAVDIVKSRWGKELESETIKGWYKVIKP